MRGHRNQGMLPSAMLVAFLGIIFSLWNAFYPSSVPCWTDGCQIFKMAIIEGVSLWTVAAGAFIVLFVAAFWGLLHFGYIAAGVLLSADIILLLVMVFVAPCGSCLIGALFLALLYLMFRDASLRGGQYQHKPSLGLLAYIWIAFFIINIGTVIESSFTVWALPQATQVTDLSDKAQPPVRIFVSSSCTACKQLIEGMEDEQFANVSIHPVLEDLSEFAIIKELRRLREESIRPFKEDYAAALKAKPLLWHEYLEPQNILLLLHLWRNQAHVVAQGGVVPLIEIQGVPMNFLNNTVKKSPAYGATPRLGSVTLPIDFGVAGACGGTTTPPCPE